MMDLSNAKMVYISSLTGSGAISGIMNFPDVGTTNYAVFTSYINNIPQGTGGTYNAQQTSMALGEMQIYDRKRTSFSYCAGITSGQNHNLSLYFLIIPFSYP